jgi:SAM-dependent methyltransferase
VVVARQENERQGRVFPELSRNFLEWIFTIMTSFLAPSIRILVCGCIHKSAGTSHWQAQDDEASLPGCNRINMLECSCGDLVRKSFVMSFEPEAIRAFEHAGWQRAAASYDDSFAHATAPFFGPLLEAAEFSPGDHVLDIACGPGHLAAAAAARGATAQGLDFSAAMVGVARNMHPEVVVTEGDAEKMPYPDNIFHAAVSGFGMHHVPRPQVALSECRRVLKPGAHLAFTVWATPDENIAWSLVFDAVARHGNRSATNAPLPGALNRPEQCLRVLEATDFIDCSAKVVRAEWILPSADGLVAALSAGTVRMAALIAAQEPSALAAMINDIAGQAERFRRNDHLAIPIAAVLARGRKSIE